MARSQPHAKTIVDLSKAGPKGSRIRRDPPPPPRKVTAGELRAREARIIVIGITAIGLALFVVLLSLDRFAGLSLADHVIELRPGG